MATVDGVQLPFSLPLSIPNRATLLTVSCPRFRSLAKLSEAKHYSTFVKLIWNGRNIGSQMTLGIISQKMDHLHRTWKPLRRIPFTVTTDGFATMASWLSLLSRRSILSFGNTKVMKRNHGQRLLWFLQATKRSAFLSSILQRMVDTICLWFPTPCRSLITASLRTVLLGPQREFRASPQEKRKTFSEQVEKKTLTMATQATEVE